MDADAMYSMVVRWICRRTLWYLGTIMHVEIHDFYECHRDLHKRYGKYGYRDLRDSWNRALERIHRELDEWGIPHDYMAPGKRGRGGPRIYAAIVIRLDPPQLYFPKLSEYCESVLNLPRRNMF